MEKRYSIGINIAFTISYIYFITFYSQGTPVTIPLPSKIEHFLFQSESGMIPLALISLCLIVVAIASIALRGIKFSKITVALCGFGFVPTIAPILCNIFFGPIVDEKSDILWLAVAIILLIYLIAFQILFIRDYKRIDE